MSTNNTNPHYIISLWDDKIKTVEVNLPNNSKNYTYKTHLDLTAGDHVVCPVAHNGKSTYTIGVVSEVHTEVMLDRNDGTPYKWVVQKVDTDAHEAAAKRDEDAIRVYRQFQRANTRRELAKQIEETAPGLSNAILEITSGKA